MNVFYLTVTLTLRKNSVPWEILIYKTPYRPVMFWNASDLNVTLTLMQFCSLSRLQRAGPRSAIGRAPDS